MEKRLLSACLWQTESRKFKSRQGTRAQVFKEEDIATSELPPYNNMIIDLDNYIVEPTAESI